MRHHFAPGPASLLSRLASLVAGEAARRRPLGTDDDAAGAMQ
jgi:hypothetical protein